MKRILVPIDFSKESMNALSTAHSLALGTDSDILLLHIVEDPNIETMKISGETHYDPMDNVYVKLLLDKTKERLGAIVNEPRMSDLNISYKIEVGNPYSTIAENIASHNATLIVMGSTGATGLQEILVGSGADKSVRYASCPVIVVKEECSLSNIKDIVLATDLDDDQVQIVGDLKVLQEHLGAKLHILKMYDSDKESSGDVQDQLKDFAKLFELSNVSTVAKSADDLADAILEYSKQVGAGMIALGTHDRHGLLHLLAGRVSQHVLNHSNRPIWTKSIR